MQAIQRKSHVVHRTSSYVFIMCPLTFHGCSMVFIVSLFIVDVVFFVVFLFPHFSLFFIDIQPSVGRFLRTWASTKEMGWSRPAPGRVAVAPPRAARAPGQGAPSSMTLYVARMAHQRRSSRRRSVATCLSLIIFVLLLFFFFFLFSFSYSFKVCRTPRTLGS